MRTPFTAAIVLGLVLGSALQWGVGVLADRQLVSAQEQAIRDLQSRHQSDQQQICWMAYELANQHEVVRHIWPSASNPLGIVRVCREGGFLARSVPQLPEE